MAHVPNESQDVLGNEAIRKAISFKAHDRYEIDGDGLNKLQCFAARLGDCCSVPLTVREMREWADLLKGIVRDSTFGVPTFLDPATPQGPDTQTARD